MPRDYFNSVYDRFWDKQTKVYGISKYEKFIIHEIVKRNPEKVFEVGIGNGWPIGCALAKKKIKVCGCDVSKYLVEQARRNLNNDNEIYIGELKEIKPDTKYDLVYCVRTSWYIRHFDEVIQEMLTLVNDDGVLIFDIMEKMSLYYCKLCWDKFKTIICRIIGLERIGEMHLFFYSKKSIERLLQSNDMIFYSYNERTITKSKDYWNTPKRIYICKRGI